MTDISTTLDGILNRRVWLEQPARGYRVAVDTVFLAAAVAAQAGERILDLGCGVGGTMLAVACRVAGVSGVGIEAQDDLVALCQRNIDRNVFAAGLSVRLGDVTVLPPELKGGVDHVLMNPPYHEEALHDVSENRIKRQANSEREGDLPRWLASAQAALKPQGSVTIIHRADRGDEMMGCLTRDFGDIEILPLVPREGDEAKRVIIRARRGAGAVRLCRPFVLHKQEGGFSDEAEAVLRHLQPVTFQSP